MPSSQRQPRGCHWLAIFVLVSAPSALIGQLPPAIAKATEQLRAGHPDSAVAGLEAFFQANPSALAGRLLLGDAYRQLGRLDDALAAYQAVTGPRPARLQARFNAAPLHLRRGDRDAALTALEELKASGAFDLDLVYASEELADLHDEPRFEALRLRPEDFEHPFVEPVRIIHEWVGETKGDQFSWIARGIGDVDGDGITDIVGSAPSFGAAGVAGVAGAPGKIYLYSGRTGREIWTATGRKGDNLGTGLEGAGDVDSDGAPDVIAGAPGNDRAYVYSGRNGAILLTLTPGDSGIQFGQAASSAGDQDGDGHADLIVGAPAASAHGPRAGAAFVFSGRDGHRIARIDGDSAGHAFGSIVAGDKKGRGTPLLVGAPGAGPGGRGRVSVYHDDLATPRFVIDAGPTGTALGAMFTSLVGDLDGDQVTDVYASDFSDAASGPATGRVYLYSGKDGHQLFQLTGENPGDGFGIGSAEAGDLDGDGHDDLVIGAWQYAGAAPSGGRVYLYSGKDGRLIRAITGRIPGETFGFDATGVGDVDGDGAGDLLLTSSWSNIHGFRSGRMFVVSGR